MPLFPTKCVLYSSIRHHGVDYLTCFTGVPDARCPRSSVPDHRAQESQEVGSRPARVQHAQRSVSERTDRPGQA